LVFYVKTWQYASAETSLGAADRVSAPHSKLAERL
jgi:hypothetical protein